MRLWKAFVVQLKIGQELQEEYRAHKGMLKIRGVVRGGARGARAPPQFWGLAPQKMRKIKNIY